ncbi:glucokinase [Arenibaculum pallidiluteum]|uniref:glucokinase n=1 Tax=Arenibaculum pallidiluteum TaxID=2812559 RepID=UPI001A96D978|nr:glucokinase [Arenibaculum pallidiluteum]
MTARPSALVADIGATNARFGLLDAGGTLAHSEILSCAAFPTLDEAARAYLARAADRPRRAAFAVAGPVTGDRIAMTNHPWSFSVAETRAALDLDRLEVVNDFTAVALSVPLLGTEHRAQIGGGAPVAGSAIGVIGPGSGLGVSGLVPVPGGGWRALSGEGGHVTMAAVNDRESAILTELRRDFDHVSAERVCSGMGIPALYAAIQRIRGAVPEPLAAPEITSRGLASRDEACAEALETFCAMLGTTAGNLALTLGARGGIYIAGGIVPRFLDFFGRSAFRARFEQKGRMRAFLAPIPTYVVTHPLPAFLGLRAVLES